jgi:LPS-assembly lipoprotein
MQKRTLLTALASVPLLAACGFKLRGSVDFAFKSLYLNGSANSAFLKELQRHLEAAGSLQVLRDPTQAEAIFDDLGQRRERVVVSRNAAGEVRELQIRLITRFRVRDAKGGLYVPDSELMQYREISYLETYALSKANEEEMLYRNMQTDIVQQIVRRLAIVKSVTPTE